MGLITDNQIMKIINEISSKFYRWTSLKSILFLVIMIILYFVISDIFSDHSLDDKKILELQLFYTPNEAYQMIESYGEVGRTAYLTHLVSDVFFLILYSLLFTLILSKLYITIHGKPFKETKQRYLNLLPFIIGFLDVIENMIIAVMISQFPQDLGSLPVITVSVTTIKMIFAVLLLLLLLYRLGQVIRRGI
jgi:hypothetical protein